MSLAIALVQADFKVGAVASNTNAVIAYAHEAVNAGADVVLFPEMTLSGYPAEDLWFRRSFQHAIEQAVKRLSSELPGDALVVVGYPLQQGQQRFNVAGAFVAGECVAEYKKRCLPNYDVFDECRYFTPGQSDCVVAFRGYALGILICEDLWEPDPLASTRAKGVDAVLVLNASPFHADKWRERESIAQSRAKEHAIPIVYVNAVGGQDELVFDGASFIVDRDGEIAARLPLFESCLELVSFDKPAQKMTQPPSYEAAVWSALVVGVRDYVVKNGFSGVVLGLSGGIDSAVTLAVAVDALGPSKVRAVMMPYEYTSAMSLEDAAEQASRLGVRYEVIPIAPIVEAFMATLAPQFSGTARDTTEENLQARCRGVVLMALSNKTGDLVVTTGNKSENAVGYATLYGDMAGGFNVLKDVPKTLVYRLAHYRNHRETGAVIPQRVIDRPPSAELAPDQTDQDSLPDYHLLDDILERYVEQDQGVDDMSEAGFDRETVLRVVTLVDRNEYKRRQAPVGVRITPRAFGRDRRYPITSGWRHE